MDFILICIGSVEPKFVRTVRAELLGETQTKKKMGNEVSLR
jgi:hypothetical protein